MAGKSYKNIEQDLRDKIRRGYWPAGGLLPSRRDLAKDYGVTGTTVQRAIVSLIADGSLLASPRKATVIAGTAMSLPGNRPAENAVPREISIGIVAELPLAGSNGSERSYHQTRTVVQSVERTFSNLKVTTRFANILQIGGGHRPMDAAVQDLVRGGVDGIVVAFSDEPQKQQRVLSALRNHPLPLVYVASRELSIPVPYVYFDNRDAGFQAAKHLLDQGCTKVVVVCPFSEDWAQERFAGARQAFEIEGVSGDLCTEYPPSSLVAPWNWDNSGVGHEGVKALTQEAGYQCGKEVFASGVSVSGIIAANDHVAFGILKAAGEAGKIVGRDYLLAGFDDVPDARLVNLTTMRPPLENMGAEAADLVFQAILGRHTTQHLRLRSHLVARPSTRREAAAGFLSSRTLLNVGAQSV